ncbi:MAG: ORF6N domain-containing protein [Elusimicrobia bacterium]|nr:ORF6N domain-containing protein [Elusimicrobiota bacterium]
MMLDRDLAELYGVKTKVLNQAYRRNRTRFPEGFVFRLMESEQASLMSLHERYRLLRHARRPALAFTDYGVAMLSSVLRSPRAVRVNVRIIQAFVRMRRLAMMDRDLKDAVTALQAKVGEHDESIRKMLEAMNRLAGDGVAGRPVAGFLRRE